MTTTDSITTSKPQIDPVCGMTVDPASAEAKSEFKGKQYYFCNPACKRRFDADPKKYVRR